MNNQLSEDCRAIRMLGDRKVADTRQQAAIAAKYWNDAKSLSAIGKSLECYEQWIRKLAGAGAVLAADLAPEDQTLEWAYQLSLFPRDEWDEVADVALIAGLDATGLSKLRKMIGNLSAINKHFCLCRGCDHGASQDS